VVGIMVFVANMVGILVAVGADWVTAVDLALGVLVTVAVRVFARVRVGMGLSVAAGT
jgi:hypothetical protein